MSAVLVEVDPKGGVVGTRSKALPWQADDAVVPFTLELKPPRAITLALQFTFADGSTRLSSAQPMRTVTKAAFDKEMEAFSTAGGQLSDVMKRAPERPVQGPRGHRALPRETARGEVRLEDRRRHHVRGQGSARAADADSLSRGALTFRRTATSRR